MENYQIRRSDACRFSESHKLITLKGPTGMRFQEAAIVRDFYVHLTMMLDGQCFMEVFDSRGHQQIPPPAKVVDVVRTWVMNPFSDGLSFQDWIIHTMIENNA